MQTGKLWQQEMFGFDNWADLEGLPITARRKGS